jgi:hypothetical protein
MDDFTKARRDVENDVKERIRDVDGHDIGDDIGNAGDRMREGLGNAGDDVRQETDRLHDRTEAELERERLARERTARGV